MVRLDQVGFLGAAGLNGVGIDSALPQDPIAIEIMPTLQDALLHGDKLLPDNRALGFGITHGIQLGEKLLARVIDIERARGEGLKDLAHKVGFAFAHQAGVDVGGVHPFRPQRPQADRVSDRGVHSARGEEEDRALSGNLPNLLFHHRQLVRGLPILVATANIQNKIFEHPLAAQSLHHLRVKLDAIQSACLVADGGHGASGGGAQQAEAGWQGVHLVAVAHPNLLPSGGASEQRRVGQLHVGQTVFAFCSRGDVPV